MKEAAGAHETVMKAETVAALQPKEGGLYLDATFGAGGLTRAILASANCRVFAIDRDPDAVSAGRGLVKEMGDRFRIFEGPFAEMEGLTQSGLAVEGRVGFEGIALDIGVSSPQIDRAERGFSFLRDGPLDMRMSKAGPTAAEYVNGLGERSLADLFYAYGEERRSRGIARALVARRVERPFTRTVDLAETVARAAPARGKDQQHPATRVFQALRIAVNDELGQLARGLAAAERLLLAAGRLAVISFHSLEDRIVKRFFLERSGHAPRPSRHRPDAPAGPSPSFRLLTKAALTPAADELARNPRSRSAKLRIAERLASPAFPFDLKKLGLPEIRL